MAWNALSAELSGISIDPVTGCKVTPGSSSFENLWPYNATASTTFLPGLLTSSPGNNGIFKGDYHINDHHELSGMFFRGQQNEQAAGVMVPLWGTLCSGAYRGARRHLDLDSQFQLGERLQGRLGLHQVSDLGHGR